ncbi:hypothetical protein JAAARDRAFT_204681 [Jaapia argillacea MUCL 33604]|uniref:Uncharacterized protein n=1 Tax=Jaapia argillacea MUCL 33604 TaxID=933084 RepID=A0A067QBJ7_9AGAM|nr:hypothetical protein JAAARDRAFT_204681 [Jaapia argillacea MUCL 33604]
MERLPDLSKDWLKSVDQDLISLLPSTPKPAAVHQDVFNNDTSRLYLATSCFTCRGCTPHVPLDYRRLLSHHCMSRYHEFLEEGSDLRERCLEMNCMPWSKARVKFDDIASKSVNDILKLCQKDATITTSAEFEDLDVRLECTTCSRVAGYYSARVMMTPKAAVKHQLERKGHRFKVLDMADTVMVKMKEVQATCFDPIWRCVRCRQALTPYETPTHMAQSHNLDAVGKDDTYRNYECNIIHPKPISTFAVADEDDFGIGGWHGGLWEDLMDDFSQDSDDDGYYDGFDDWFGFY